MRTLFCLLLFCGFVSSKNNSQHNFLIEEVKEDSIPVLNFNNVKNELIKRNIPCWEIVLAQSQHESGNYTSRICKKKNNIFGMKGKNGYKKYSSWIECIDDYEQRFSKRYKGGDYFEFLIKVHYHEDPNYEMLVKKFVKK